jgi:hypothetical protein
LLISGCSKYQLAHLVLHTPNPRPFPIRFDTARTNNGYALQYADTTRNDYLRALREGYGLQALADRAASAQATVLLLLDWTHRRWKHNGGNQPAKPDALTILQEAQAGRNFRCVEYATVLTDALLSLGFPARTLALKTRDAQSCKTGAGHVLVEVFLAEHGKWVLLDGQFNLMPLQNGVPLNAVELQAAIVNHKDFQLVNGQGTVSKATHRQYRQFIAPYLYYFETALAPRKPDTGLVSGGDKTHLMLVPLGAEPPTVFQRRFPIDYCHYTHSLPAFYQPPLKQTPGPLSGTTDQ